MQLAALAVCLFAAHSDPAGPLGELRARYTVHFLAATDEAGLQKVVGDYEERLDALASQAKFAIDAKAATIAAEFPLLAAFVEEQPADTLEEALGVDARPATLPPGGLVQIDDEWLRVRDGACERGLLGSSVAAHAVGAKLRHYRDDFVWMLLSFQGELEFLERPQDAYFAENKTTLAAEHERVEAWRKLHPGASCRAFEALGREHGGPPPGCVWRPHRASQAYELLVRASDPRFQFKRSAIASVGLATDALGYPAVSFQLVERRAGDFGDWTQKLIGKGLAIVLDEQILTLATVRSRLPGSGMIMGGAGGFTKAEAQALMRLLSLPELARSPQSVTTELLH